MRRGCQAAVLRVTQYAEAGASLAAGLGIHIMSTRGSENDVEIASGQDTTVGGDAIGRDKIVTPKPPGNHPPDFTALVAMVAIVAVVALVVVLAGVVINGRP